MKQLGIVGAGGHGRVVADLAEKIGYEDIVFFDDGYPEYDRNGEWPVVGKLSAINTSEVALGMGDNSSRLKLIRSKSLPLVTLIHPDATVSKHAKIGVGTIVCAGAVIGPFAQIGSASIVNTSASIDHDCKLGDGVHISPGAHLAGGVVVGEGSWVGIGASVCEYRSIGSNVMIGAGAAVISDVANNQRIAGIPAKLI